MAFKLRPFEDKDAELMLEWMHDPDINRVFAAPFATFTLDKVRAFISRTREENAENLHLACVDENDVYLGTISLKNINRNNENAEYAISFRKCAHGSGAAIYATHEILRIAFEELNLKRVYLYVLSMNLRANRFYQKAGFVHEGTLRKHVMHNGTLCDEIWYGILKEDWETKAVIDFKRG